MGEEEFRRQLDATMRPQPVIEQARGVLMFRRSLTSPQAFNELVRVADTHGVRLADLSEALVNVVGGAAHLVDERLRRVIGSEWTDVDPTAELPGTR